MSLSLLSISISQQNRQQNRVRRSFSPWIDGWWKKETCDQGQDVKVQYSQLFVELLPSLRIFVHIDSHTALSTWKLAKAITSNLNLPVIPPKHIRPLLPGMHLAYMHPLAARPGIAQHDRAPKASIPRAVPDEAKTRWEVKVLGLLAVCIQFASQDDFGQDAAAGWWEGVFAFDTKEVSVKDAGIAAVAEEDEGVGQWLEPISHGSLEGLVGLRVVIHYERLGKVMVSISVSRICLFLLSERATYHSA